MHDIVVSAFCVDLEDVMFICKWVHVPVVAMPGDYVTMYVMVVW